MSLLNDVVKSIDTSGKQKEEISETLNLMVELTKTKADYSSQTDVATIINDAYNHF